MSEEDLPSLRLRALIFKQLANNATWIGLFVVGISFVVASSDKADQAVRDGVKQQVFMEKLQSSIDEQFKTTRREIKESAANLQQQISQLPDIGTRLSLVEEKEGSHERDLAQIKQRLPEIERKGYENAADLANLVRGIPPSKQR